MGRRDVWDGDAGTSDTGTQARARSRAAQRSAASLHHRSRAATTVLVCEQKPYPV